MKTTTHALSIFVLSIFLLFPLAGAKAQYRVESVDNNFPSEIKAAAEEGKNLVIFFHQAGCPYCDKMRARVLPAPKIVDYFSKNFILIESNIRGNLDVVMPSGKTGTERDFAKKNRVRATPVFIFYDKKGNNVLRLTGYQNVKRFYLAGKYVVDGVYKQKKSFFRYLQEPK